MKQDLLRSTLQAYAAHYVYMNYIIPLNAFQCWKSQKID